MSVSLWLVAWVSMGHSVLSSGSKSGPQEPVLSAEELLCSLDRAINFHDLIAAHAPGAPLREFTPRPEISCAVVGNSGVLRVKPAADKIDQVDRTIRFDQAPLSGFEEFVGEAKQDIWVWSDSNFKEDVSWVTSGGNTYVHFVQSEEQAKTTQDLRSTHVEHYYIAWPSNMLSALRDFVLATYPAGWFPEGKDPGSFEPSIESMGVLLALTICGEVRTFGVAASQLMWTNATTQAYWIDPNGTSAEVDAATVADRKRSAAAIAEQDLWRRVSSTAPEVIDATGEARIIGFSRLNCSGVGHLPPLLDLSPFGSIAVLVSTTTGQICSDTEEGVQCKSRSTTGPERFTFVKARGRHFSMIGGRSGKYCSVGDNDAIKCDSDFAGPSAKFFLEHVHPNKAALRSAVDNRYCVDKVAAGITCDQPAGGKITDHLFQVVLTGETATDAFVDQNLDAVSVDSGGMVPTRPSADRGLLPQRRILTAPLTAVGSRHASAADASLLPQRRILMDHALPAPLVAVESPAGAVTGPRPWPGDPLLRTPVGETFVMISGSTGRFCSDNNGVGIICDSLVISNAEKFEVTGGTDGKLSLRNAAKGRYCSADAANHYVLSCSRDSVGTWELFTLEPLGDSRVAIKSQVNGKYCTDTKKQKDGMFVECTGVEVTSLERFAFHLTGEVGLPAASAVLKAEVAQPLDFAARGHFASRWILSTALLASTVGVAALMAWGARLRVRKWREERFGFSPVSHTVTECEHAAAGNLLSEGAAEPRQLLKSSA